MRIQALLTPSLLLLAACSSADYRAGDATDDSASGAPQDDADTGSEGEDDGWGSETEDDFLKLSPATTEQYVFVVNASRNTVSRITVPGLQVLTVEVGSAPAAVTTTADNERAIVFNEGSDDVSIIDAETLEVATVGVLPHLNAMVLSDDGVWAVVYRDADEETDGDSTGAQSFNELSLVNTLTLEHFPEVVGFKPRQVRFTEDSSLALVVADEYLTMIDLSASTPSISVVEIAEDLLDPPRAEEVEVSPDGTWAFLRQFGEDQLVVVDLLSREVQRVDVGQNPTDLDITPDGTHAVVVSRGSNELYVLDTTDPFQAPEVIDLPEDELIGSVQFSPDNSKAVLYTTAAKVARYTSWDLSDGSLTVRPLVKPIERVTVSPDGGTLLVFHTEEDAEDADPTDEFYGEWAVSMISLQDFRRNALLLQDEPTAWAHSTDGAWGYFVMEGVPYLEVLDYTRLSHKELKLRSSPVHVGVLPNTDYAFVNQEHELGRLTFYDPNTEQAETITGFELNSGIEH